MTHDYAQQYLEALVTPWCRVHDGGDDGGGADGCGSGEDESRAAECCTAVAQSIRLRSPE